MDKRQLTHDLNTIAAQEIPDNMNKWPEIRAKIETPTVRRSLRLSGVAATSLTLVVLLMTSLVAYAVHQWGNGGSQPDPGIDGVRNAGLVQPINVSQTVDDITITLAEGYADSNRILLWATIDYPADMPPEYLNTLMVALKDGNGEFINANSGASQLEKGPDAPPNQVSYLYDFVLREPLVVNEVDLHLAVQIGNVPVLILPLGTTLEPDQTIEEYMVNVPPFGPFDLAFALKVEQTILTLSPNVVAESNGVTITLSQVTITPSHIRFILCYDLPTTQDWRDHFAEVAVDDVPALALGSSPVNYSKSEGLGSHPCINHDYSIAALEMPQSLTIRIDRLQTSVSDITAEIDFDRAAERLAAQGIVVTFDTSFELPQWTIVQKPDDMSDFDAEIAVLDSLAEWYEGEWVFEIPLNQ